MVRAVKSQYLAPVNMIAQQLLVWLIAIYLSDNLPPVDRGLICLMNAMSSSYLLIFTI